MKTLRSCRSKRKSWPTRWSMKRFPHQVSSTRLWQFCRRRSFFLEASTSLGRWITVKTLNIYFSRGYIEVWWENIVYYWIFTDILSFLYFMKSMIFYDQSINKGQFSFIHFYYIVQFLYEGLKINKVQIKIIKIELNWIEI